MRYRILVIISVFILVSIYIYKSPLQPQIADKRIVDSLIVADLSETESFKYLSILGSTRSVTIKSKEIAVESTAEVVKRPQVIVRQAKQPINEIERLILKYANKYGVDYNRVLRIARCESGLRSDAVNGQYKGIYQQGITWWAARSSRYGRGGESIFNADANIEVSIAMMAQGGYGHWACK